QEQHRLGHEAAVRLQEELDEEERQRMASVHEACNTPKSGRSGIRISGACYFSDQ
ncbi:hypothetical protein Tco_0383873, partial [Tanacetum coccineum]